MPKRPPSTNPADSKDSSDSPQPTWLRLLTWACFITVPLILILICVALYIRHVVISRLSTAQFSEIKRAETDIVALPDEWHQPAKIPPQEISDFWNQFTPQCQTVMTNHHKLIYGPESDQTTPSLMSQMSAGDSPVNDNQRSSFTVLMADLQPVIQMTSASVSTSGYTLGTDLFYRHDVNFLMVQSFAKLMSVAAQDEAANGHWEKAIDYAVLPLRMAKRPEQSRLIDHLIGLGIISISIKSLDKIASECTDVAALAYGASLLKELRGTAFPGDYKLWRYGEVVGPLRVAAAIGYPVDLSPQTMASYYRQFWWLSTPKYYNWLINKLPPNDRRVKAAKAALDAFRESQKKPLVLRLLAFDNSTESTVLYGLSHMILGVEPSLLLFITVGPNFEEPELRAQVAMTMYDLTQMRFAQRLAELKGEPMPAALPDPFSSGTLQYSEKRNAYYSVGPDKVDQKAALPYDATNGTMSPGDVIVGRER